jgi:alkaline phosphatase D
MTTCRRFWTAAALVSILAGAASEATAAKASQTGYPRLMQGPMVGALAPTEVKVWVRTSGPYAVALEYDTDPGFSSPRRSEAVEIVKADDYTGVITVTGLEPATEYFYRVIVDGIRDRYLEGLEPFRFETAPPPGEAADLRIAFGSCPKYQDDRIQPIWPWVAHYEPDILFWIGDNVYADTLDPDIIREEYRRQRDVPALQPILHDISHLAVWDDHDYGLNNHDRTNPIKEGAYEAFLEYWANPSYGLPQVRGIFFKYTWGQVEFFFLDDRWYRDPAEAPDEPGKTMLGSAQLEWLESELEASDAVFKVLVSGSGFSVEKGPGGDSWAAYLHERDHLFDFIRDREITGVVLLSGDTHIGELNVIPWSARGGYDYYDLVSSPLAQMTPDSWLERRPERRIWPAFFQSSNFGLVDFHMDDEDPRLVFQLIDIHGRSAWGRFELRASELVNGVTSWPAKVHPVSKQRQENLEEGKGYYEAAVED